MAYQPPLPNSSRLIDWGHSWVAPPPSPYAASNIASPDILGSTAHPWSGEMWPNALRDALGIGSSGAYYRSYQVPAVPASTTTTTFLDLMPDDGTVDSVWFVPNGALTGSNTNTRRLSCQFPWWAGTVTINAIDFTAGINMVQGTPIRIFSMNDVTGINSAPGVPATSSPFLPALRNNVAGSLQPQELMWKSNNSAGTGLIDPGGTVIIRYGTRYRNYGVGGATLLGQNGPASGTWQTSFSWSPVSHPNAIEVNVTAAVTTPWTSITCSQMQYPMKNGSIITFTVSGTTYTATLNGAALFGATTLTVTGLANNIPAGTQGHAAYNNGFGGGSYETLSPTGVNVWTHGINDANSGTYDRPAWIETVRAVIARNCCPNVLLTNQSNFLTTNGGGTWAAQATSNMGALPAVCDMVNIGAGQSVLKWTGTVSGSPKVDISVGPAFEGGTVDLFLLPVAGAGVGVTGSVTVDGATPPQGTVTFSTSSVSTSALATRTQTGCSTATTTTLTFPASTITAVDIGKVVTGTNVPAGTVITAILSTTTCTLSNATTGTAGTLTMTISSYYPMVKRITGLAAGGHVITLTITASDSVANSVLFLHGLGLESQSPKTPVLWCNIARCPAQSVGQKTAAANYNADSAAVIAGTALAISGNTTEPALGSNVQFVDIDTLLGNGVSNAKYFLFDGLHMNDFGHRLMARNLFSVIRNSFSPDQLMAR